MLNSVTGAFNSIADRIDAELKKNIGDRKMEVIVNGISIEQVALVAGEVLDKHHLQGILQKFRMWQQEGIEHEWRGLPLDKAIEVVETAFEMVK